MLFSVQNLFPKRDGITVLKSETKTSKNSLQGHLSIAPDFSCREIPRHESPRGAHRRYGHCPSLSGSHSTPPGNGCKNAPDPWGTRIDHPDVASPFQGEQDTLSSHRTSPLVAEKRIVCRLPRSYTQDTVLKGLDLGFLKNGELLVTGWLKDLIIIHGQNH